MRYGREFRWFAWHPVNTDDRGLRWLRFVWRRRMYAPTGIPGAPGPIWVHRVEVERESEAHTPPPLDLTRNDGVPDTRMMAEIAAALRVDRGDLIRWVASRGSRP